MSAIQKFRLRARSDRELITEVENGKIYVDHDTGEEFEVVSAILPLAPSPSDLPWAVENLRICDLCLQFSERDMNECRTCGRRSAPLLN